VYEGCGTREVRREKGCRLRVLQGVGGIEGEEGKDREVIGGTEWRIWLGALYGWRVGQGGEGGERRGE